MYSEPALPSRELLCEQAAWLAPARSRLLRRVGIATRQRILDVASGPGAVTGELASRCAAGGAVVALDRSRDALKHVAASLRETGGPQSLATRIHPVQAEACHMPFPDATFDLAFCQFTLMWLDASAVVAELARVLKPGGAVVAIEPDYGGMIEYPPEIATRSLWRTGLSRAGADAEIGRRLPGLFAAAGFRIHVELLDRLVPPSCTRFVLLRGLPLAPDGLRQLTAIEQQTASRDAGVIVAHLPIFLLTAELR